MVRAVSVSGRDYLFAACLLFGIMFLMVAAEAWDGELLLVGALLTAAGLAGAR